MHVRVLVLLFVLTASAQAASDEDVRALQQALEDAGYNTGGVDGKAGRRTRAAIEQYQSDWELAVDGKVTAELIERVTRQHPATRAGMLNTQNGNCRVENPQPQARETVTWTGACVDGLAEGNGTSVWRFLLAGEWQEESYVGAKSGGKRSGKGISLWHDGERYEGEWRDNLRHGTGRSEWPNGNSYFGEWRQNLQHGIGTIIWYNGDRYVGEWRNGTRSGKGIFVWSNGDRHDGDFANDKRQGSGIFLSHKGDRYDGEFADDRPNGSVILSESDGTVHEGEWQDGCFSNGEVQRWFGKTKQACGFE